MSDWHRKSLNLLAFALAIALIATLMPVAALAGGAPKKTAGAGDWTALQQSNPLLPGCSTNTDASKCVVDSNGTMHLIYPVSKAISYHGNTYSHNSLFHTTLTNGKWSTPALIAMAGDNENCNLYPWGSGDNVFIDNAGFLNVIFTKGLWWPDPFDPNGLDESNVNFFAMRRSPGPSGTWSAPTALSGFNGFNSVLAGSTSILNLNNQTYVSWIERENTKDGTNDGNSVYNDKVCAVSGDRESWSSASTLATYTYKGTSGTRQTDISDQISVFDTSLGGNRSNGEAILAWGTVKRPPTNTPPPPGGFYDDQYYLQAAVCDTAGTWGSPAAIAGPDSNQTWTAERVQFLQASGVTRVLAMRNNTFRWLDATVSPNSNAFIIDRVGSSWRPAVQVTNLSYYQTVANVIDFFVDPGTGKCSLVYEAQQWKWDDTDLPPQWADDAQTVCVATESASTFTNEYATNEFYPTRFVNSANAAMDNNGAVHVIASLSLFDATDPFTGAKDYQVLYNTNAVAGAGAGLGAPVLLNSPGSGNKVPTVMLAADPSGGVSALWRETTYWNFPPQRTVGDAYISRYRSGGTWSAAKTVNTGILTSNLIMQKTDLGEIQLFYGTHLFDEATRNYYDTRYWFAQSQNGGWPEQSLIAATDSLGAMPSRIMNDTNNRSFAIFNGWSSGGSYLMTTNQKLPTPSAAMYFFAEGTTRNSPAFNDYLCIQNPGDKTANVTITYMLGTGENKDQAVQVPAHSRFTVSANGAVPNQDISTRLKSDQLVVVERPMYFDYNGWTGGHDVVGTPQTSKVWYFAEGTTRTSPNNFTEYITIQNPSSIDTNVTLTYMLEDGSVKPQVVSVKKRSRFTVNVNAAVGANHDVSTVVRSDQAAVVAERPMYFNYTSTPGNMSWNGGHVVMGSIGTYNRLYFAEGTTRTGFQTWLSIQNPNSASVKTTITYILGDGSSKTQEVTLKPTSRQTVDVNAAVGTEKDVSIMMSAPLPILAERPMYFNYKPGEKNWNDGHDVVGTSAPKNSWFFAEGTTRNNAADGEYNEWLSLQNPNATDATVGFKYMLGDGSVVEKTLVVAKRSRSTVDVNAIVGANKDVSVAIWSDIGIIAERPMYFNYKNTWNGGHDVMGQ